MATAKRRSDLAAVVAAKLRGVKVDEELPGVSDRWITYREISKPTRLYVVSRTLDSLTLESVLPWHVRAVYAVIFAELAKRCLGKYAVVLTTYYYYKSLTLLNGRKRSSFRKSTHKVWGFATSRKAKKKADSLYWKYQLSKESSKKEESKSE